jgi:hypothetical protein
MPGWGLDRDAGQKAHDHLGPECCQLGGSALGKQAVDGSAPGLCGTGRVSLPIDECQLMLLVCYWQSLTSR